jgi:hypothetical protein
MARSKWVTGRSEQVPVVDGRSLKPPGLPFENGGVGNLAAGRLDPVKSAVPPGRLSLARCGRSGGHRIGVAFSTDTGNLAADLLQLLP